MPLPLLPLIGIGAGLLGQGINAASTAANNRKQREWNEKMYGIQRRDSLADWTMQNEYNSPQAQMQRLKDAKLNPNLVYGQGAVANSSSGVRSTEAKSWNPQAPQVDLGDVANRGIGSYIDWELKKAQTDNLKAQNSVILQDAALKAAQIVSLNATVDKTKIETIKSSIQTQFAADNYMTSLEAAKASLDKTVASTQVMMDENERREALNSANLQLAAERILSMRLERMRSSVDIERIKAVIENLKKDGILKQLDINLKEKGIQPGDPMWMRTLSQVLDGVTLPKSGAEAQQRILDINKEIRGFFGINH